MKFEYKGTIEVELFGIKFKPGDKIEVTNPTLLKDFKKIPQFEEVKTKTAKKGGTK